MNDYTVPVSMINNTFTIPKISSILFYSDKFTYKYSPQQDITPYELAKLLVLFIHATHANYDWGDYIETNELLRHFIILPK